MLRLFKGRLGRGNFLVGILFYVSVILLSGTLLIDVISSITSGISCDYPANYNYPLCGIKIIIFLALLILPLIFAFSSQIRRLHDLGWSGWSFLLLFIPFVNIYYIFSLYFKKGQDEENKYGKTPNIKISLKRILSLDS